MLDRNVEFASSFELWELVVSFEDGSLPIAEWNEQTLAVVAIWYLFLLPPAQASARLQLGLERNRFRLGGVAGVPGEAMASVADAWPLVLRQVLAAVGIGDPLAIANRVMQSGVAELRDRAA